MPPHYNNILNSEISSFIFNYAVTRHQSKRNVKKTKVEGIYIAIAECPCVCVRVCACACVRVHACVLVANLHSYMTIIM